VKALLPIKVTLVGIVMLLSDEHPLKASLSILVYLLGTTTGDDGQPKNDVYTETDDGIAVVGIRVPLKASFPMYVTLVGIVMLLSDVHPLKALSIIVVTLVGIVTLVSDVHL